MIGREKEKVKLGRRGKEHLEEEGLSAWRADLDCWLCSQTDADLIDNRRFDHFETEGEDYVVNRKSRKEVIERNLSFIRLPRRNAILILGNGRAQDG